ncbi:hypothetical protein [Fusibacter sp. JL216-2]|uniref:hypothetical protein n=1 Tax=Fusibacter sp. JL216-2 TaxID=3071453 RepID=UPI003D330CAB
MDQINDLEKVEELDITCLYKAFNSLIEYSNRSYKGDKLEMFNEKEIIKFIEIASTEIGKVIDENGLR